jgi:hypothetical protein
MISSTLPSLARKQYTRMQVLYFQTDIQSKLYFGYYYKTFSLLIYSLR